MLEVRWNEGFNSSGSEWRVVTLPVTGRWQLLAELTSVCSAGEKAARCTRGHRVDGFVSHACVPRLSGASTPPESSLRCGVRISVFNIAVLPHPPTPLPCREGPRASAARLAA